jgi:cytosine/uracil/thiamine/allantoin permease
MWKIYKLSTQIQFDYMIFWISEKNIYLINGEVNKKLPDIKNICSVVFKIICLTFICLQIWIYSYHYIQQYMHKKEEQNDMLE